MEENNSRIKNIKINLSLYKGLNKDWIVSYREAGSLNAPVILVRTQLGLYARKVFEDAYLRLMISGLWKLNAAHDSANAMYGHFQWNSEVKEVFDYENSV